MNRLLNAARDVIHDTRVLLDMLLRDYPVTDGDRDTIRSSIDELESEANKLEN